MALSRLSPEVASSCSRDSFFSVAILWYLVRSIFSVFSPTPGISRNRLVVSALLLRTRWYPTAKRCASSRISASSNRALLPREKRNGLRRPGKKTRSSDFLISVPWGSRFVLLFASAAIGTEAALGISAKAACTAASCPIPPSITSRSGTPH